MRAVVFDLFHTLVDTEHLRPPGFDAATEMALVARVDRDELAAFWAETYLERETTPIDLVELLDRHCADVARPLTPRQRRLVDDLLGTVKDDALRHPRPEILSLVERTAATMPVGVLSNCHERETRCWTKSPLAALVEVFVRSCDIGSMKPDPRTYRAVLDHLRVEPACAIYVGNGGSDELLGARGVGFARVIHCNVFDRSNGLVTPDEQRRRAGQADATVDTVAALARTLG